MLSKKRVETMGVAVLYLKQWELLSFTLKRKGKAPASEAPEYRTAPSSQCVGLKLSNDLLESIWKV